MKIISFSIFSTFLIIINLAFNALAESKYPQTREERQAEEMGSLLGGEGLVFKPGHMRNESTKNINLSNTVNQHLWKAARQVVNFMPIATIDANNGIIITDWYSTKNKPNYGFKIEINITGDVITPEFIEVKVYERKLLNSQWYNEMGSQSLNNQFEDQILRKARENFIASRKK